MFNSIDASVLDSDVLRQSEDFEVKMLEELIVQVYLFILAYIISIVA